MPKEPTNDTVMLLNDYAKVLEINKYKDFLNLHKDAIQQLLEINAKLLTVCKAIYSEVDTESHLGWHLNKDGYTDQLRDAIAMAEEYV